MLGSLEKKIHVSPTDWDSQLGKMEQIHTEMWIRLKILNNNFYWMQGVAVWENKGLGNH